jgi:hypothetical protein
MHYRQVDKTDGLSGMIQYMIWVLESAMQELVGGF